MIKLGAQSRASFPSYNGRAGTNVFIESEDRRDEYYTSLCVCGDVPSAERAQGVPEKRERAGLNVGGIDFSAICFVK